MRKYFGGKLRRWDKLSKDEQSDLLFDLLNAFASVKNVSEATEFLIDLFTRDEVRLLSKRLRIAKMLINDKSYEEIRLNLKVGMSTIAKVSAWLEEKGNGFRKIISRLPEKKRITPYEGLSGDERNKRKHPRANWLELTFDRWRDDTIRAKDKELKGTLETLGSKDVVRHRIDEQYAAERRNSK